MLVFVHPDDSRLIHVYLGDNPSQEPDYIVNLDNNNGTGSYSLELMSNHEYFCHEIKLTWSSQADDIRRDLQELCLDPAMPDHDINALSQHYYAEMQSDLLVARNNLELAYKKS